MLPAMQIASKMIFPGDHTLISVMTHIMQICSIFDVAISCWICSNVISMVPFTHAAFFVMKNCTIKRGLEWKKWHCKKIVANLLYVCQGTKKSYTTRCQNFTLHPKKLKCLLDNFEDIMSSSSSDIGYTNIIEMDIETDLYLAPVISKPYTPPLKHQEWVRIQRSF